MRATTRFLFLISILIHGFSLTSYALSGSLDSDFSDDGMAVFPIVGTDRGLSVALDSAGRIVAGGYSQSVTHNHLAVARLLPDGFLDDSFSKDGRLDLNFVGHLSSEDQAIAVQPDGKIVAVGSSHQLFAVFRFMGKNTADLKIAGGTANPTAETGESVAFTLTVTNIGPDPATEAVVNYTAQTGAEGAATSELTVAQYDDDPDTSDNNATIALDIVTAEGESTTGGDAGSTMDDGGSEASDTSDGSDMSDQGTSSGGCSLVL